MSIVNTYHGFKKPKQRVSKTERESKEHLKQTAQYYKDACEPAIDRAEAERLHRIANGELHAEDYTYVTNPLNTKRPELMGYPARMVNYDIISTNLSLLMGEKVRRNFPPMVIAVNSNYYSLQMEEQTRLLEQELQKRWVNEVIQNGITLDEEQINAGLEEIQLKIKSIPDTLASEGQDSLEYIMYYNEIPRQFRMGFYDWLVTSSVFSYKDVHKNKVKYQIVDGAHLSYLCTRDKEFIEDGDAVRAEYIMSVNEVFDRFNDDPDFNEEVKEFTEQYGEKNTFSQNSSYYGSNDFGTLNELWRNTFGSSSEEKYSEGVRVEHVQWRGFTKFGKLTRQNIFGEVIVDYVDEDFIPVEGDQIEWEWLDQIYEGYCIEDKYWVGLRPIPIQRAEYNDPHKSKLLYNGRNKFSRYGRATSLVKKGIPYQKTINIIKYRAEETLNKNLDKIILFPLGLIPKKEGWDEFKLMYYIRAFSILFFDDSNPHTAQLISALKDLNLSSTEHILQSYQMVQAVKQEWDEVCGINPQRKSQIGVSAGKGVTQEAIERSYIMSEENFLEYEEFENREYTGFLELSKFAFVDGIQSYFVRQDGTKAFLNIYDPSRYVNTDFGVFTANGSKELSKLEMLRNQVTAFAQNQVDPKMISSIIKSENYAKLDEIMDEIDAKLEARRQQELTAQQNIQASKEKMSQRELDYKYYDSNLTAATDVQVALIKEGIEITDQMRKLSEQRGEAVKTSDEYLNLKSQMEDHALKLMENSTKLKKIASDEKIAREKNQTALKNKVVGERK